MNASSLRCSVARSGAAALVAMAGTVSAVHGQYWDVGSTTVEQKAEGFAQYPGMPPCNVNDQNTLLTPGLFQQDLGGYANAFCGLLMVNCPLSGGARAQLTIDGLGEQLVRVKWDALARTYHNCELTPYAAMGVADLAAIVKLEILGLPVGTPIDVSYQWSQFSFNRFDPEIATVPPDDPARVSGKVLLNGTALFGNEFDFDDAWGLQSMLQGGTFTAIVGTPVLIEVEGHVMSGLADPGVGGYQEDLGCATFAGELILSFESIETCPPGALEFSVDIGSDTELCDHQADGNEAFDPGDAYRWKGAPLPPGGADGIKNDKWIFAPFDFAPVPGDASTKAPVCSGLPPSGVSNEWFDMDAHDSVDFDLVDLVPPDGPLSAPISRFPSACVWDPVHLVASFDDDRAGHYVGGPGSCEVPVSSSSPYPPFSTFGRTITADEVVGLNLVLGSPYVVGAMYPVETEKGLHLGLQPDPVAATDKRDDDTDSLDAYADPDRCGTWLFSPDHEATGIAASIGVLDPGAVYQVLSSGPVLVVHPGAHLGLEEGVDVDAFEFTWSAVPGADGSALTLLFSVDDDDPLTPNVDESGGLDSRMIYASYLTGYWFPFIDAPLISDVDALSIWCRPMFEPGTPPCLGDLNNDGIVDGADLGMLLGAWATSAPAADLNGDGTVDGADLGLLLGNWGPC